MKPPESPAGFMLLFFIIDRLFLVLRPCSADCLTMEEKEFQSGDNSIFLLFSADDLYLVEEIR